MLSDDLISIADTLWATARHGQCLQIRDMDSLGDCLREMALRAAELEGRPVPDELRLGEAGYGHIADLRSLATQAFEKAANLNGRFDEGA
ncbi:MAG: hypothetical protein KDH19_01280 [Geminicoccaceae bacterium]|nr:hypothetical protein [Geminicoccaceae bacterium]